ncbi:uncharacterized protein LOC110238688 [Exaiptasia diaphana]|uniref:Uncharacterized protein n=1 Tax=Exaiptasia diaphana TaxID=2652724 RepID=A0A913X7D0_EXADI|nr:uncharacterized protein LOC110238688 [Exaiptasia diaphana]
MPRDFLLIIALLFVALNGCKAQDSAADDANECRESNDTVYAVASMGEFPPLYETLHDLYSTVTTFPVIEECSKETASLNNFEEKVKTQAQTMSTAALAVDRKVKEAGKAKALQGEAARQSSCVWQQCRRLYKKQQDMLSAISDGVKDRLLIRAEKIGGQIRNQTKEWTIEQVKEALEKELSDVKAIADALSPSVKDVVEPIITQVIANNVASQVNRRVEIE